MPEIRYYKVRQTREVRVAANDITDAAIIARVAFRHGQDANGSVDNNKPRDVWGDTRSRIQEVELEVKDDG